jgi:ParB/RepB/Spo0J family partition protein
VARPRKSMGERIATATTEVGGPGEDPFTASAYELTPTGVLNVRIDLIDADEENLRGELGELAEMAQSIKEMGVLQPVLLRPTEGGRYVLVAGHRRRAAAILAGETELPAVIRDQVDDLTRDLTMLVENLQREDLTPLEEARGYQRVVSRKGSGGQSGLARRIGRSQGHISKRLALLKLPEPALAAIESGSLSLSDAAELVALCDEPGLVAEVLTNVKRDSWRTVKSEVQRHLAQIEQAALTAATVAELQAAGVPEIPAFVAHNAGSGPYPVAWMGRLSEEEHRSEPCHAWRVERGQVVVLCTEPDRHRQQVGREGDAADDGTDPRVGVEETPWQAEQRRKFEERQAEEARQEAIRQKRLAFAAELVAKSKDYAPGFAARIWLLSTESEDQPTLRLVAQLLGQDFPAQGGHAAAVETLFQADSGRYAQRVIYATALAAGDQAVSGQLYSEEAERVARMYLDHLRASGYQLSEDEQAKADALEYEQESVANGSH